MAAGQRARRERLPWVMRGEAAGGGAFASVVAASDPAGDLSAWTGGGPPRWPEVLEGGVRRRDEPASGPFVVEDLDASCALLRSMGLEPTDVIDYDPGRRVYFRDPDNIEVELVEY